MFELFKAGRPVLVGLLLAFSAGALQIAHADERYREHEYREHEFHERQYLDGRYHHDRYYPPHGFVFGVLPPRHYAVFTLSHKGRGDGRACRAEWWGALRRAETPFPSMGEGGG